MSSQSPETIRTLPEFDVDILGFGGQLGKDFDHLMTSLSSHNIDLSNFDPALALKVIKDFESTTAGSKDTSIFLKNLQGRQTVKLFFRWEDEGLRVEVHRAEFQIPTKGVYKISTVSYLDGEVAFVFASNSEARFITVDSRGVVNQRYLDEVGSLVRRKLT